MTGPSNGKLNTACASSRLAAGRPRDLDRSSVHAHRVSYMPDQTSSTALARQLSTWDATLITAGSILGSAVFLTTGQIARLVPHAGVIVAIWIGGGIITLT